MISQVAASEREEAQTAEMRGCRNCTKRKLSNQKVMESTARDGESPVRERTVAASRNPEYDGTREILSEAGGTIRQG